METYYLRTNNNMGDTTKKVEEDETYQEGDVTATATPQEEKNVFDGRHVWKYKKHNKSIVGDRRYQMVRNNKSRVAGQDGANVNMHYSVLSAQQRRRRQFVGEALRKSIGAIDSATVLDDDDDDDDDDFTTKDEKRENLRRSFGV